MADDSSVAAKLSTLYGTLIVPIDGGFRVRQTETTWIDVMRQMVNWQVISTPREHPGAWDRGYCFFGRDHLALLRAVNGALNWDADNPESHPPGWDKNAVTGELANPRVPVFRSRERQQ